MELHIKGISSISPIENFENISNTPEIKLIDEAYKYYSCIEPLYKEIINPLLIRRMSRAMKIGIASALLCLKDAKVENPDAIITATGLGCVEDSDKFLTSLIENEEKMLNPTPFIQSTHNTISSQIALILKCHGYNTTYAGRGACFETALLDAKMLIYDDNLHNVLIGAYDELIANQIRILYRLGLFKNNSKLYRHSEFNSAYNQFKTEILKQVQNDDKQVQNDDKQAQNDEFTNLPGEGATYFVVSPTPNETDYAKIVDFEIVNNSKNVKNNITDFLVKNLISIENINSVMIGNKSKSDINYNEFTNLFPNSNILWFKHLCGEYLTSSAFALWLSANILKNSCIPDIIFLKKANNNINNVLIINKVTNEQTAIFLISK